MRFTDLLYEIFNALKANKARSALTVLGIVIGIASVVTLTSLIAGMQQSLLSAIGADQARVIQFMSTQQPLTLDDLEYIETTVPEVESSDALTYTMGPASVKNKTADVTINGVTTHFLDEHDLEHGRYFVDQDDLEGRRVVILSAAANRTLFGAEDADSVGETIQISGLDFEVIGVISLMQFESFGSQNSIYLPFKTQAQWVTGDPSFSAFTITVKEGIDPTDARDKIVRVLELRYPAAASSSDETDETMSGPGMTESFIGITANDMSNMVGTVTSIFTLIFGSVAGISLLVGGIGIMNMMLTNVQERIREIGLRKSVGASSRDVTNQFLGESITLCLLGGVVGLILGLIFASLVALLISVINPSLAFTPSVTPGIMLIAFGVSTLIGIIFGYAPARRAAKLDPVESLRHQ